MKSGTEDEKLTHGSSVQGDEEAAAKAPEESVKGMGSKRISMIDRYEMGMSLAKTHDDEEENARKRQSIAMRGVVGPGEADSGSTLTASQARESAPVVPREAQMSDEELDSLFKRALAYSRPILEGTHEKYAASDSQKLRFYALFKQAVAGT